MSYPRKSVPISVVRDQTSKWQENLNRGYGTLPKWYSPTSQPYRPWYEENVFKKRIKTKRNYLPLKRKSKFKFSKNTNWWLTLFVIICFLGGLGGLIYWIVRTRRKSSEEEENKKNYILSQK